MITRGIRLCLAGLVLAACGTGCRTMRRPWRRAPLPAAAVAVAEKPPAAKAEDASATEPVRYVRRDHLRFHDEQEIGEYVAAAARKREAAENYRALRRMLVDKAVELQAVNETLDKEYKLTTAGRYEFDDKTKTILEVIEDGKGGVTRRAVLTLTDPEVERKVSRLLAVKNRIIGEASTIQSGMARQEAELVQLQNALAKEYGVARDRDYVVDSKSRMLVERVPMPKRFKVEGEEE